MTTYLNADKSKPIQRIEVEATGAGNQAVMFLRDAQAAEDMREILSQPPYEQIILNETFVDGKPVFITHSNHSITRLMDNMQAQGSWGIEEAKSPISAWGWRAILGLVGQGLVMRGSFARPREVGKMAMNMEQFTFAACNIAANFVAIGYGASSKPDPHQLRFLKEEVNNQLTGSLDSDRMISATDNRSSLRNTHTAKSPIGQVNQFMAENSSQISIGLRYFGAFNLAKTGLKQGERSIGNLMHPSKVADNTRYLAGLGTLGGKTIALSGKLEDSYDPVPPNWMDKLRHKFFLGGGLMEAASFGSLAIQNMQSDSKADRYFAAGNAMFVLAYIIRTQAKLGNKKLDMSELYSHISDSVARLPEDERAQTVADMTGMLKTHFGIGNKLTFTEIYEGIAEDLHKNHGISVFDSTREPEIQEPETTIEKPQSLASKDAPTPKVQAREIAHHEHQEISEHKAAAI